jgi:glycosyltransferase involved in cell wall biosynthesis
VQRIAPPAPRRIHAVFAQPLNGGGISYPLTELLDHIRGPSFEPVVWCPQRVNSAPVRDYHRATTWNPLYKAACKVAGLAERMGCDVLGALGRATVAKALEAIQPGDIVYAWPPYDAGLIFEAKRRGAVVIGERVNCMGSMCRDVLEAAYGRLGRPLPDGWCTDRAIAEEREQMALCDYVTAPGPFVRRSLLQAGIRPERIIETSYGWSPERLSSGIGVDRPQRPPVFLFVGIGCVRKGLDVLLEAWERAGVRGELQIAGNIDPGIRASHARQLARPDVRELGYVEDIGRVYAGADVFAFPSHEEGGPQVIYEAAACGLPSIVSPMGAGRVVRHGGEGIVVDPLNVDALADAIHEMACAPNARREMGRAAAERAHEFTWARVGARLRERLNALFVRSSCAAQAA